jgi:hypothetical protein
MCPDFSLLARVGVACTRKTLGLSAPAIHAAWMATHPPASCQRTLASSAGALFRSRPAPGDPSFRWGDGWGRGSQSRMSLRQRYLVIRLARWGRVGLASAILAPALWTLPLNFELAVVLALGSVALTLQSLLNRRCHGLVVAEMGRPRCGVPLCWVQPFWSEQMPGLLGQLA